MNKALFLDRDGVINRNYGHVHTIDKFIFRKGIFELTKYFLEKGFLIFIITNQAGISKGLYTQNEFLKLTEWMITQFNNRGIIVTKVYYCPHNISNNCNCRKPKPGMIIQALKEYNINTKQSFLIGDKMTDLQAGKSAKIQFLYNTSNFRSLIKLLDKIKNHLL